MNKIVLLLLCFSCAQTQTIQSRLQTAIEKSEREYFIKRGETIESFSVKVTGYSQVSMKDYYNDHLDVAVLDKLKTADTTKNIYWVRFDQSIKTNKATYTGESRTFLYQKDLTQVDSLKK